MSVSNVKNIDVELEIDVLTAGSCADFVNELLEFLLYQRNQIPFVYKTYKYYIDKWPETNNEQLTTSRFQLQRQRDMATKTKNSISDMRELIRNIFKESAVKCLRFLFGATSFTAKESYTIHIPKISRRHFHEKHPLPQGRTSQALISLITREELYAIFSTALSATNVFLELELLESGQSSQANKNQTLAKVFPKDFVRLPISCKDVHLNLLHSVPILQSTEEDDTNLLKCCKELEVFQDITNAREDLDSVQLTSECNNSSSNDKSAWWEADVVVRGFKEQSKAFSIWSS